MLLLGFSGARAAHQETEDHVPTKLQLIWEAVVGEVNKQVEDNLGKVHPFVVPLAVSLFFFILIATGSSCCRPSSTTTAAPAAGADRRHQPDLRAGRGDDRRASGSTASGRRAAKGYFKHFLEPFPVLLPLNILEELIKPITLALRLFGNIFAGGIMLALIGLIPIVRAVGAQHPLEAVRHGHRRHPGLHLRAADRPLLRDGRRRSRRRARRARRADEHEAARRQTPTTHAHDRPTAVQRTDQHDRAHQR